MALEAHIPIYLISKLGIFLNINSIFEPPSFSLLETATQLSKKNQELDTEVLIMQSISIFGVLRHCSF
jgi:hypothetical protein